MERKIILPRHKMMGKKFNILYHLEHTSTKILVLGHGHPVEAEERLQQGSLSATSHHQCTDCQLIMISATISVSDV